WWWWQRPAAASDGGCTAGRRLFRPSAFGSKLDRRLSGDCGGDCAGAARLPLARISIRRWRIVHGADRVPAEEPGPGPAVWVRAVQLPEIRPISPRSNHHRRGWVEAGNSTPAGATA